MKSIKLFYSLVFLTQSEIIEIIFSTIISYVRLWPQYWTRRKRERERVMIYTFITSFLGNKSDQSLKLNQKKYLKNL